MNIREQFEKETGVKAVGRVTDGIHSVPAFEIFSFEYVGWLEKQVVEAREDQS